MLLAICAAMLALPLMAATYDVGPGQAYTDIGAVPWESLAAGDTVRIHWRPEPYREKWVICVKGTVGAPITVTGVPGPNSERPVISGENATTRTQLNYWGEPRGVIKIGGASIPVDTTPEYIVIENLEVRSARPPFTFTDDGGTASVAYADNAAAVYIEKGWNITVRNCEIHDSSNGIFAGGSDTKDLLIEHCYIHDNGNVDDIYVHNTYIQSAGIIYQYNRFGPLRTGCPGNNLKDRSAGCVVRYNWLEGGNRQLDLVDSSESALLPSYNTTWVYGNILIEPDGTDNRQMIHYGGDGGDPAVYRKGTLHLYNNTLVSTRAGRTTLVRLSTDDETCDCRNNIIYVTDNGNQLELIASAGTLNFRNNWLKPGYATSFDAGATGSVNDLGGNITGTSPGFTDESGQAFGPLADSPAVNAGTTLHADALPLTYEYVKHQQVRARPTVGTLDIGAYEYCPELQTVALAGPRPKPVPDTK
jgi:hypothetical protein